MSVQIIESDADTIDTDTDTGEVEPETEWAEPAVAMVHRPRRATRLYQRGMVTAEYAVGILAAVALALVLFKIFHDSRFVDAMLKQVTAIIGKISSQLPG